MSPFFSFPAGSLHRRLAFLLPLFLLLGTAHAQTAKPSGQPISLSPEDKERGLNGEQSNFYFAVGDKEDYQNAGFFGQRIRPYLAGNQEALDFLNDYRRQKALLLGERTVFLGSVLLYGQQVLAGDKQVYFNNKQKVLVGVAAVSLLANVFISRNTNQHIQRAVAEYNSGLPSAYRSNPLRRLSPSAIGLMAPTGLPQLAMRWSLH
jgi:hypothetical protein